MPKSHKPNHISHQMTVSLDRWLERMGLAGNPFAIWNAEHDMDLPSYYIDNGIFDEFLNLEGPGIVFAKRGCGKTAQRQMIASHCRPVSRDSKQLAISYTYNGFERVLESVDYDVNHVQPKNHIQAILYLGVTALMEEAAQNSTIKSILESSAIRPRWSVYTAMYFHPSAISSHPDAIHQGNLSSVDLLRDFASLIIDVGLERCVVLLDGVDEFPQTANPKDAVTFLAPLLGTLAIIENPGFAFKFFLPTELEAIVRSCNWFRADRLRTISIAWEEKDLIRLIGQRLIHYSSDSKYSDLAELCADDLRPIIDNDLAVHSMGLPRNALILADKLLHFHCLQSDKRGLIGVHAWEKVKDWWVKQQDHESQIGKLDKPDGVRYQFHESKSEYPILVVDEVDGRVFLGEQEIRREFHSKEYSLLKCLYKHRETVCSKELLAQDAWSEVQNKSGVSDQAIAASIKRLREVLSTFAPKINYIETIKGKRSEGGYRLHPNGFAEK